MNKWNTATPVDKMTVSTYEMDKIIHFTGVGFIGETVRRARPTSTPEFVVVITDIEGETHEELATIVVNNVPGNGQLDPNKPLAIAMVEFDGTEHYLLINGNRTIGDRLIQYEGEPEDLLEKTHLFDNE